MEAAAHRGRGMKKAPVGTILLLVCVFIPTLTSAQPSKEICDHDEYLTEKGICCNKCSPGSKLVDVCHATGQRSNCTRCPSGQYMAQMNSFPNCFSCRHCKVQYNIEEVSPCESNKDAVCRCAAGYYKKTIDSESYECRKCTKCGENETEKQTCTPERNTVCSCKENYYRANGKCKLCTSCAECKHLCTSPAPTTKAPDEAPKPDTYFINIIVGAAVVTVAVMVLMILITYVTTKSLTKKKLLKQSTQPPEVSPDSCEEVLIQSEEPSDNMTVKAVPQSPCSEQEPSNLPDCVPQETISDLIYTVLDLVPGSQVKQLMRSLGVRDTEIEQAETDNRFCREAHYQMLRVWAERGSRGGGGGGGRILHWPLLQELVDKLRKMHLGLAAEQLEIQYGIQ